MRRLSLSAAALAALIVGTEAASASPVNSVVFNDGNVLDVVQTVGTGANTAYEVIDFPSGLDIAYAYKFDGSPNGYTMLNDIDQADPNLAVDAPYSTSFGEHFVNQFTYGSTTGYADGKHFWDLSTGTYSPALVSAADPQGTVFAESGVGIDDVTVTNGLFVGWTDDGSYDPVTFDFVPASLPTLPETAAVPEPASVALLAAGVAGLCVRHRHPRGR